jgi:ABC-type sugar transport system substrate-binding protein
LGFKVLPLKAVAPPYCSVSAQKKLLIQLQREGMVGVCIQATDPAALANTVVWLQRQDVVVITTFEPVDSERAMVHAGLDDEAVGAALADAIGVPMREGGTIAILHAASVGKRYATRRASFQRRILAYPGVRVLLEKDCKGDPAEAQRLLRETMRRYPRLDGWVVMDNWPFRQPWGTEPLVPHGCRIVLVDPFPFVWPAYEDGTVHAAIASEYDEIADHAVRACLADVLGGANLPVSYKAPVRTVWSSNLDTFKADWRRWSSAER